MNTTNALRQTDRQSTLVMDAKCSSLHKYAPPSWCFLGSVDRVAYLFGLPVDVTGPRGSVTWLRSASAASRRLSRRFFGARCRCSCVVRWCALVCYPGSTTSTTCEPRHLKTEKKRLLNRNYRKPGPSDLYIGRDAFRSMRALFGAGPLRDMAPTNPKRG